MENSDDRVLAQLIIASGKLGPNGCKPKGDVEQVLEVIKCVREYDIEHGRNIYNEVNTSEYMEAPSGRGPHAYQWADKPHRLVYRLCAEVERLRKFRTAQEW